MLKSFSQRCLVIAALAGAALFPAAAHAQRRDANRCRAASTSTSAINRRASARASAAAS